jgi:hypothetical protein
MISFVPRKSKPLAFGGLRTELPDWLGFMRPSNSGAKFICLLIFLNSRKKARILGVIGATAGQLQKAGRFRPSHTLAVRLPLRLQAIRSPVT